jgi:sugar lactone lactonase YvrE
MERGMSDLVLGPARALPGTAVLLGESPVWDPRTRRLRWVDLFEGPRHHTDPVTGVDEVEQTGASCGFVALAVAGLVFARGSLVVRADDAGERVVADLDPSGRLRINDSQVAPGGWLFCGLMGVERSHREGTGRLVRVDADGTVTPVSDGISVANGMGWSPDGRTMYHVDTMALRVDRLDFDSETGTASNRRPAFTTEQFGGIPDGLAVDAEGRIWLAHFGTPYVVCTDEHGREITRVELPVPNVTSCAFGGEDLSTLFVATSWRDATAAHPDAGAVFAVPTSTRGQQPRFAWS